MKSRYDVLVIGGRCAGASTAMLLAREGLSVLVVDKDTEGSDTLSTHALMRGGVMQLFRWGLLGEIEAAGTPAVGTTTFHYGEEAIEIAIQRRDGVGALYAPRRTVLDRILVEGARAAGAEVVHGIALTEVLRDGTGRVRGARLRDGDGTSRSVAADLLIGADGVHSRVARLVQAPVLEAGHHACAVVYRYFEGMAPSGFHWYYTPGVSAGVIPTNAGRTCVFVATPAERFRRELRRGVDALYRQVLLETSPDLARAVAASRPVGKTYPFPGIRGYLRHCEGPGWALVGDAGFFRDPITAHGITDALRDAELLSRAVLGSSAHGLPGYPAARNELALGMLRVSDRVASFQWDLEEVKVLHLELSRRMNAEVDLLRGLSTSARCPVARPLLVP